MTITRGFVSSSTTEPTSGGANGDELVEAVKGLTVSDDEVHNDLESLEEEDIEPSHPVDAEQVKNSQSGNLFLPPEVVDHIFSYVPDPFPLELLFVCRLWYHIGLTYIYEEPALEVKNYGKFVETISGSDYLGSLVKVLDLRNIIQSGKNSYTSRLLRRCSKSLRTFVAPQTSFGYAPLLSLKQCKVIENLDLGLVSETVDLRELFGAIKGASHLQRLEFPRSSVFCSDYDFSWPKSLKHLGLSGGVSNEFLNVARFPSTITYLSLSHCPFITAESLRSLMRKLGEHLITLHVLYPLPALRPNALDSALRLCPKLINFTVSVDYITRHLFELGNLPTDKFGRPVAHCLRNFTLDSSGLLGQGHKIEADDISLAILEDKIPDLVNVRISNRLGWNPNIEEIKELVEVLEMKNGGVYIY